MQISLQKNRTVVLNDAIQWWILSLSYLLSRNGINLVAISFVTDWAERKGHGKNTINKIMILLSIIFFLH